MKIPSQKSTAAAEVGPKAPTRKRGKARVEALLAAAEAVIAARGYEAATMTEIAEAAGASIGSLYQFFPTKEVLAEALHAALLAEFARMLAETAAPALAPADRAVAIMEGFGRFLVARPAFPAIADRRSIDPANKAAKRARLRTEIAAALTRDTAALPEPAARVAAVLILVLMRAMIQFAGETASEEVEAATVAMRAMLRHHLETVSAREPS
jgi:AcrR family transcriptional regulator